MNTTKSYDWENLYELSIKFAPGCNSWAELARVLDMPRRTLSDGFEREFNIKAFQELLARCEEAGNISLLAKKAEYWEKVADRLEKRITDRRWLKEEVAGLVSILPPVEVGDLPSKEGYQEQVAVLEISDVHNGAKVPLGQLGVLGYYNSDMAASRTIYTFETFAKLAHQQSFPVRKAKVYLLGDLIEHSNLRPGQAKETDSHVVKQTMQSSNVLIYCLRYLCSQFEEVEVEAVPGNHSRTTKKPGENLPDETFEHLIYYTIEVALSEQKNFHINNHESWYFLDNIFGYKFLGLHAEDVLSWAGVPFYGIERLVKDYYMMLGQSSLATLRELPPETELAVSAFLDMLNIPDYVTIGHFHTPMMWNVMGVEVLANGSMSGVSVYSTKKLHRLTPPAQQMFFVHPEWGVSLRCPIKLARIGVEKSQE